MPFVPETLLPNAGMGGPRTSEAGMQHCKRAEDIPCRQETPSRITIVGSFAILFPGMVPGTPSVAVLSCRSTRSHAQGLALSFSLPLSQISLTVSGNHSSGCWAALLASALFLLILLGLKRNFHAFLASFPLWSLSVYATQPGTSKWL